MPSIRSSSDLRNFYNQISEYCHTRSEPVYITKNGKGDLVVLDKETYEELVGRFELSTLLDQGLEDMLSKRTIKMQMNFLMNWKEGTKMPRYNLVITETPQHDLLDIFDYIAFELQELDSTSRLSPRFD